MTSSPRFTARTQELLAAITVIMATLGVSIVFQILATRWPLQFGDVPWRYDTLMITLSAGPQLLTMLGIIALIGSIMEETGWIRAVAVALIAIGLVQSVVLPLASLDFLQLHKLQPPSRLASFDAVFLKTFGFSAVSTVIAFWGGRRAWRAAARDESTAHREIGDGLIVGQPSRSGSAP